MVIAVFEDLTGTPPKKVDVGSLLPNATTIPVEYCNGVYLAAGGNGELIRSTDGANWSAVNVSGSIGNIQIISLDCLGDRFFADVGNASGVQIYYSDDGSTWNNTSGLTGITRANRLHQYRDKVYAWSRGEDLHVSVDDGQNFDHRRLGLYGSGTHD